MKQRPFDFAVIEGDQRQQDLAQWLTAQGYSVCRWEAARTADAETAPVTPAAEGAAARGWKELERIRPSLEDLKDARCILGPIPLAGTADSSLLALLGGGLTKGHHLFGGCIPEKLAAELKCRGVEVHDYMKDPGLTVYNSIATAEGAIAEAIGKSRINLCGSRSIVLGFGVCGKTLAKMLCGLGSRTAVFARREEARQEARILTGAAFGPELLQRELSDADFIFNTVPAAILKGALLCSIKKSAVLIDIASGGGFDPSEAEALGLRAYLCPGLPGRYAPEDSARAMGKLVLETLEMRQKSL